MQLTLNYDAGLAETYGSCRELIGALVHQQGRPQKAIAADMDYSPSDLSRKLAQNPDDSRRFTLDDLETFLKTNPTEKRPIYFLIEKYLVDENPESIQKEIERLQSILKSQIK